jgi:predicted nucleotidyltransferase
MIAVNHTPTPYPDVNALVGEVLKGAQSVLGKTFVGMLLDGSLTSGDFDADSDVDFVVVTEGEISEETFLALRAMHERLSAIDSIWAIQLEGSYLSRRGLRRYTPGFTRYLNIERGKEERLKWVDHDAGWDIHRWVLRERGIRVAGPEPQTLIDPVAPEKLKKAMQPVLFGWAARFLENPGLMGQQRGYQSYIVLTLCRILYTLVTGRVASKPTALRWAKESLEARWLPLLERAWFGRHNSSEAIPAGDVDETLAFIRYGLERAGELDHAEGL